jgi:hypothetical protein
MSAFAQSPSRVLTGEREGRGTPPSHEAAGRPHPASAKGAYRVAPARPAADRGVTATR